MTDETNGTSATASGSSQPPQVSQTGQRFAWKKMKARRQQGHLMIR